MNVEHIRQEPREVKEDHVRTVEYDKIVQVPNMLPPKVTKRPFYVDRIIEKP